MVFRADRGHRGQDPYLTWKVRLFAIGATLGLAGIFLNIQALIWAAIVVLVVGFLFRFLPMFRSGTDREGEPDDVEGAPADDDGEPTDDDGEPVDDDGEGPVDPPTAPRQPGSA